MLGSLGLNWWGKRNPRTDSRGLGSFHLWIDGVGGYLVCPGNHVTVGQATPNASVDVALQADISRLHATFARDAEGYMLRAAKPAKINDKPTLEAPLRDGDLIALGTACRMRFCLPAAVSASARLDLESGHRPRLSVDAILLMADTLILGPGEQTHVKVPELPAVVVLFRQERVLGVRSSCAVTINGKATGNRGLVNFGDRVEGDSFSFSLEAA